MSQAVIKESVCPSVLAICQKVTDVADVWWLEPSQ